MKIVVTILSVFIIINKSSSEIRSHYNNYNNYNGIPSTFYVSPPEVQQPTYQNFIQAVPHNSQLHQSQSISTQPQKFIIPHRDASGGFAKYPMPLDVSTYFSHQPNVVAKASQTRYRSHVHEPKKPIITKTFFLHTAPEETAEDIDQETIQLAQQPRKHYNVIFVKAPSQTTKATALNLAKALKEEKTVVYVLSKKTTAADLQEAIADTPQPINKPEVFFIKYRTPEEAANAQKEILTQYDNLGGPTTIVDQGVPFTASVIDSLNVHESNDIEDQLQHIDQGQQEVSSAQQQPQLQQNHYEEDEVVKAFLTSNNGYLPPSTR
uniref:DUF243 domain-containing protein n=1 Tax=Glossina brevipalpis TaxID=37001 RepID=A0A1A9X408_9MUSC